MLTIVDAHLRPFANDRSERCSRFEGDSLGGARLPSYPTVRDWSDTSEDSMDWLLSREETSFRGTKAPNVVLWPTGRPVVFAR
jgi:hypothetical protein